MPYLDKWLTQLSAQLGVAVEYIVPLLRREVYVHLGFAIMRIFIGLLIAYIGCRFYRYWYVPMREKHQRDEYLNDNEDMIHGVGGASALGLWTIASVVIGTAVSVIIRIALNPEWYMINQIIIPMLEKLK